VSAVVKLIETKLKDQLEALHIEIIDNSWMHAGHRGNPHGGSHLAITVVSEKFDTLSPLERHRLVHSILKDEMQGALHALELSAIPASRWQKEKQA
jgi:BolA protein